jgi:hypothetical protein
LTNATAIGGGATVGGSNSLVLGCTKGQGLCPGVNVGTGTTKPAYSLDVSLGDAIVRGLFNFQGMYDFANLYLGDANHEVIAMNDFGIGFFNHNLVMIADGSGYVGIARTSPSNILTLLQSGGPAIADGWLTYSSRRWKTHIHTLDGALEKVEQLWAFLTI